MANANSTALELAFQHARFGRNITIYEIRRQLVSEGFSPSTITGKANQTQVIALITAATPQEAWCIVMYGEGSTRFEMDVEGGSDHDPPASDAREERDGEG